MFGAIGGAVSAGLNPLINGSGNLPPAALAGIETLVSGGIAGALGYNVQGAATAAQNETLNNFCEHNSCGQALSEFVSKVSNGIDTAMNAGADVPAQDSATSLDLLKGIGNTVLNASTFSLPGMPDYVPYFSYSNSAIGSIGELYGAAGLGELATSGLSSTVATNTAVLGTRGLGQYGGIFSSSTNAAGGEVWTSVGDISQNDFASIVNSGLYSGDVNIISGVHGLPNGTTIIDQTLYEADAARFGNLSGVNVFNFPDLTPGQIGNLLNGKGTTIGGFCNSGACLAPYK